MQDKVKILIELIARLRVARCSDDSICQKIGLSRSGLSRIIATPEYKAAQEQALKEAVGNIDVLIRQRNDFLTQDFQRVGVPEAMKALVETVKQTKDLRARLAAAAQILDRDPGRNLLKQESSSVKTIDVNAIPETIFAGVAEASKQLSG